jgi:predicted NAD-dependent protein-ADP-ribosyltransferase YbiA (DUF1768 family)
VRHSERVEIWNARAGVVEGEVGVELKAVGRRESRFGRQQWSWVASGVFGVTASREEFAVTHDPPPTTHDRS